MSSLVWSLIALALVAVEACLSIFVFIFSIMGAQSEFDLIFIALTLTALIPVLYFLLVYGIASSEVGRKKDGVAAAIICFLINVFMLMIVFKAIDNYGAFLFSKESTMPSILGLSFVLLTQLISMVLLRNWINRYPTKT